MNGKRKQILIVEDDAMLCEVFNELLITFGYEPKQARNAKDGIEIFRKNFKLIAGIILDVKMPGSDCRDVLLDLQKIDKEVKVLLTTGYGHTKEVDELLELGAKGLLQKPFRMDVLFKNIEEIFH